MKRRSVIHLNYIITEESGKMAELVNELLQLSRLESNDFVLGLQPADLRDIIQDAAARLEIIAQRDGKALRYQPRDTPISVRADAVQLLTALLNILGNCVRYAAEAVEIDAVTGDDCVRVTISDDGPGIQDEDLPRIFERFYRGQRGAVFIICLPVA